MDVCWRVAITDTGMVKSCERAAARAPRASSVLKREVAIRCQLPCRAGRKQTNAYIHCV